MDNKERLVVEVDGELKRRAKVEAAEQKVTLTEYIEQLLVRDLGE